MEPDFKAFARAWVDNDQRLQALRVSNPEAADALIVRLAQAMDRRRSEVQRSGPEAGDDLIVNVDRSRFGASGLDSQAAEQLARFLEEFNSQSS